MTDNTEIMLRAIISQNTSGGLVDAYAAVRQAYDAGLLAGAKAGLGVAAIRGRMAQLENQLVDIEILAIDPASLIEKAP